MVSWGDGKHRSGLDGRTGHVAGCPVCIVGDGDLVPMGEGGRKERGEEGEKSVRKHCSLMFLERQSERK